MGERRVIEGKSKSELEYIISEWVLNERDREIMRRRLIDGLCYEPLAEEFNLSVRHVKNIVYKNLKNIPQ